MGKNATALPALVLKAGRDKSLRQRHPWVFSGAIDRVDGGPGMGDTVELRAADGAFLARAAYSPASQIRARVWSFDARESIDAAFIGRAIERAVAARASLLGERHTGCRLIHGESDGL
ncbi:MAG TPA: 23S rRNA (cytosine(1962)-C(5))-methyltransferase RlmI, partial [Casimicrobiaceae bacterium]